jgi:hypothetical protein
MARHTVIWDCLWGKGVGSHPALTRGWLDTLLGCPVEMNAIGLGNMGLGPGVFVGIVWAGCACLLMVPSGGMRPG